MMDGESTERIKIRGHALAQLNNPVDGRTAGRIFRPDSLVMLGADPKSSSNGAVRPEVILKDYVMLFPELWLDSVHGDSITRKTGNDQAYFYGMMKPETCAICCDMNTDLYLRSFVGMVAIKAHEKYGSQKKFAETAFIAGRSEKGASEVWERIRKWASRERYSDKGQPPDGLEMAEMVHAVDLDLVRAVAEASLYAAKDDWSCVEYLRNLPTKKKNKNRKLVKETEYT